MTQNEQQLIKIGSVLVSIVLFWVLIYQPLNKHLNQQIVIKNNLQQQLTQMQSMKPNVLTSVNTQKAPFPSNTTFSSWVDRQLSQVGLQEMVNRTEPVDNNTLTVWLSNAAFDLVVDWLQSIQQQYDIVVDQIDVNVTDRNLGLTNVRMRLVKP
ncbi:MAG: type II secretion system protein M [Xanthomonadales bacterium]|nr:type II secretion system protein M [Xanthomonadales bacterium]